MPGLSIDFVKLSVVDEAFLAATFARDFFDFLVA